MSGEVRTWLMGTWIGGCVSAIVIVFAVVMLSLFAFATWLKGQADQHRQAELPTLPGPEPLLRFDLNRVILAVGLVVLVVLVLVLAHRFLPRRAGRRVHRTAQLAGGALAVLQPALLLGALLTLAFCWERPRIWRFLIRGCAMVPACILIAAGAWVWGWPLLLYRSELPLAQAIAAGLLEVLLGSLWLRLYIDLTSTAEASMRMVRRGRQAQAQFSQAASAEEIRLPPWRRTRRHPVGKIDLGVDRVRRRRLLIPIRCLRRHATLIGTTGSGKTVAIARIVHGVLSQPQPWAVLIVDCKGAGLLRDSAQALAQAFDIRFQEVNPGRTGSLGYDVTRLGGPAEVADKLTAAFPSTPESGIYRDTSYHALAHAAAGHMASNGGTVHLEELESSLGKDGLHKLAGRIKDQAPDTHAALLGIAARMGTPDTTRSALNGMASRLGALRAGRFADVLDGRGPALDLEDAASQAGITYISLPALASSADLRMMGRVLLSDLKLLAHLRLDPARRPRPCLVVLDEFSALDDPDNVRDLLRQAREPEMPCLTASQSLPEPGGCRNELLQAGLLVFLKCLTADADEFAALAGTVLSESLVREIEFFPTRSSKGAVGPTEVFRVHPRWFRLFASPGLCGVRFDQPGQLPTATIAQVYENVPDPTLAGRAWCWLTARLRGSRRGPAARSASGSGDTTTTPAWQAGTGNEAEGSGNETDDADDA